MIVTSSPDRGSTARSNTASSAADSVSRPTSGESSCRVQPGAPGEPRRRSRRQRAPASPSARGVGSRRRRRRPEPAGSVASPMRISPGIADCSSRAARLTASPVTNASPLPGSPAITSPVLTPVRAATVTPQDRWNSWFSSSSVSRSSAAARTARSASSSWRRGTPKTATTASPMNFSTVPPWRPSTTFVSSK